MKKFYVVLCASLVCAMNMFAQTPASDSKNVDCGSSVTITATPATGFHFVQWEDDATAPATRTISNIKDATLKNYKAIFAADETVIDPSIDPGVDFPVAHGTILHLTPHTDDDCQEFVRWSDGNTDAERTFNVTGALDVTAEFTKIKYTITVESDNTAQGTVDAVKL